MSIQAEHEIPTVGSDDNLTITETDNFVMAQSGALTVHADVVRVARGDGYTGIEFREKGSYVAGATLQDGFASRVEAIVGRCPKTAVEVKER